MWTLQNFSNGGLSVLHFYLFMFRHIFLFLLKTFLETNHLCDQILAKTLIFLSLENLIMHTPWKYFDRVLRFGQQMSYNVLLSVDFLAYVLQKSYFLTQNVLKKWHKMSLIVLNCPTFSFQNSCRHHVIKCCL